jgi:hypothetical protein
MVAPAGKDALGPATGTYLDFDGRRRCLTVGKKYRA